MKITIGKKLGLGFGMVVLFLVVSGLLVLQRLAGMNDRLRRGIAFAEKNVILEEEKASSMPVSAYIETLLDDTDATTARATLGVIDGISIEAFGAIPNDNTKGAINNTAFTNAFAAGYKVAVPDGTFWVDDTVLLPSLKHLCGQSMHGSIIRLVTTADDDTDVVRCQENSGSSISNLTIYGNWDLSTPGQLGCGIKWQHSDGDTFLAGCTIKNVRIYACKSYGLHLVNTGYVRIWNVHCNQSGLDGGYFEGTMTGGNKCTTVTLGGQSIFSNTPNGYGLRVKDCGISNFEFISEFTKGVMLAGGHNRNLHFKNCYFESPVGTIDYIINLPDGTGGIGLRVENSWLGMTAQTAAIEDRATYKFCSAEMNMNLCGKPTITNSNGASDNWMVIEYSATQGSPALIKDNYNLLIDTPAASQTATILFGSAGVWKWSIYKDASDVFNIARPGQAAALSIGADDVVTFPGTSFWHHDGTQVFNTTMTTAQKFQELDLSSYVGSNRALAFLEVKSSGTATYACKPKGEGDVWVNHAPARATRGFGCCLIDFDADHYGYVIVETDVSGVIQHGYNNNTDTITIKLLGFVK